MASVSVNTLYYILKTLMKDEDKWSMSTPKFIINYDPRSQNTMPMPMKDFGVENKSRWCQWFTLTSVCVWVFCFNAFYLQKETRTKRLDTDRGWIVDSWMGSGAASSELSFHCEFHEFPSACWADNCCLASAVDCTAPSTTWYKCNRPLGTDVQRHRNMM